MAALPPRARLARDLNALLKISTTLGAVREFEPLRRRLARRAPTLSPAC